MLGHSSKKIPLNTTNPNVISIAVPSQLGKEKSYQWYITITAKKDATSVPLFKYNFQVYITYMTASKTDALC